jgi:hypothetical protein
MPTHLSNRCYPAIARLFLLAGLQLLALPAVAQDVYETQGKTINGTPVPDYYPPAGTRSASPSGYQNQANVQPRFQYRNENGGLRMVGGAQSSYGRSMLYLNGMGGGDATGDVVVPQNTYTVPQQNGAPQYSTPQYNTPQYKTQKSTGGSYSYRPAAKGSPSRKINYYNAPSVHWTSGNHAQPLIQGGSGNSFRMPGRGQY